MEIFNYLSTPFEGDFAALTAELACNTFRIFCRRATRQAEKHGYPQDALLAEISKRLAERAVTTAYWTPEVAVIFKGLSKTPFTQADWHWVRTQVALSAHLTGVISSLELDVETNDSIVVCGKLLPAGKLSIRGTASRLTIHAEGAAAARAFTVVGQRNGSPVWAEEGEASRLLVIDGQPAVRVVGAEWHSNWGEELSQPVAEVTQAAVDQFQEALRLMERVMPEYRAWVLCLLKEITPIVRPAMNMIASGSSPRRFGGIDLCVPASPTETAEMMIHECSHQYFHMASWVGSMVTPDAKPHYSPLKKCERPLDRILIGYHAFGNALIAFDKFREVGLEKEIAGRFNTINGYMEQLRVPIEAEVGLSELGLAFARPLRARLVQGRRG
jgi:HEXXH motif-containing protein